MKISTTSPFTSPRGTYKTTDLVFTQYAGETVARAKVVPRNPRSAEQLKVRGYLTVAVRAWDELSAAERDAWLAYAERYLAPHTAEARVKSLGQGAFVRANALRQTMGLSLVTSAPVEAPPAAPTAIGQLGAQNPDAVGIELFHGIAAPAGHVVLVRATAAMPTVACTPRERDYRYVCGVSAASFQALGASGSPLVFSPSRFTVDDGRRYGVEARIVRTADGMTSMPVYGDFIKSV